MTEQIICAGFGGQGVLLAGQILAYAGLEEGKNVSWLPSYGPEMRGGTANCNVVVSDEEVASPVVVEADCAIVMNRPSMEMFEQAVKPGGLLIMNSDLIEVEPSRDDIRVLRIPANSLAEQAGSVKAANMVVLGVYNACANIVDNKTIIKCLEKLMGEKKKHLIPLNEKAIDMGSGEAKKQQS
ncbi:2-oxoacid:acceptor oxidoreductase family protein [Christensenellaceae bacterium OttesenSCG-928-K19]|nr:2-oxoacid:acceptor oxidoreductase family protein [Christensenellaceae bacterium OttesenSCG-928-K19]